jgi:hypothetical protein
LALTLEQIYFPLNWEQIGHQIYIFQIHR